MRALGEAAEGREHFLNKMLPAAVAAQCEQMDKRDTYIFEEARFLENTFLSDEGLIHKDKFVGMFGLVGLAECVNTVLRLQKPEERYGHGKEAEDFALMVLDRIHDQVASYKPRYGSFAMHGQVGISTDTGVTPNTRIPVGESRRCQSSLCLPPGPRSILRRESANCFHLRKLQGRTPWRCWIS